jgi:hypothetical protein
MKHLKSLENVRISWMLTERRIKKEKKNRKQKEIEKRENK